MEIQIKAYAYTIDIITEIRYFCKCNNAVFGKFRIIFTCAISKTDCSLHHNFHTLFKISGNGKFVRTAVLPPHPSHSLRKSTPRPRPALNLPPLSKEGGLTARHKLLSCCILLAIHPPFWFIKLFAVKTEGLLSYRTLSVSQTPPLTIPQSQWRKTQFSANASSTFIKSNIENVALHCASSLYTRELKVIVLYQPF